MVDRVDHIVKSKSDGGDGGDGTSKLTNDEELL